MRNDPPPATELIAPATTATMNSKNVMNTAYHGDTKNTKHTKPSRHSHVGGVKNGTPWVFVIFVSS